MSNSWQLHELIVAHQAPPGKNARVGCHPPLGDIPTQGSNPGLPQCKQTLYPLSHQGSPPHVLLFHKCNTPLLNLAYMCLRLFSTWKLLSSSFKTHILKAWKRDRMGWWLRVQTLRLDCLSFFSICHPLIDV